MASTSKDATTFVRGNAHLNRLLADPETSADVAATHEEIREMDHVHAMPSWPTCTAQPADGNPDLA